MLRYGSRRHDATQYLMLLGQRLPSRQFNVLDTELLATGELRPSMINLMRLDLDPFYAPKIENQARPQKAAPAVGGHEEILQVAGAATAHL